MVVGGKNAIGVERLLRRVYDVRGFRDEKSVLRVGTTDSSRIVRRESDDCGEKL